jgi:hypothetical protein
LKKFIQFFRQAGAAVNIQFLKYRPQRGTHRAFRYHQSPTFLRFYCCVSLWPPVGLPHIPWPVVTRLRANRANRKNNKEQTLHELVPFALWLNFNNLAYA